MFHKVILLNHKVVHKFNHFKKVLGFGIKKNHSHKSEHNLNFHKLSIRPNLNLSKNKLIISGGSVRHIDNEPKTKIIDGVKMKLVKQTKRPIRLLL